MPGREIPYRLFKRKDRKKGSKILYSTTSITSEWKLSVFDANDRNES